MRRRILQSSINIRCTDDLLNRLDVLAESANQHRSELVREAIALLLRSHEDINVGSPTPAQSSFVASRAKSDLRDGALEMFTYGGDGRCVATGLDIAAQQPANETTTTQFK